MRDLRGGIQVAPDWPGLVGATYWLGWSPVGTRSISTHTASTSVMQLVADGGGAIPPVACRRLSPGSPADTTSWRALTADECVVGMSVSILSILMRIHCCTLVQS